MYNFSLLYLLRVRTTIHFYGLKVSHTYNTKVAIPKHLLIFVIPVLGSHDGFRQPTPLQLIFDYTSTVPLQNLTDLTKNRTNTTTHVLTHKKF